MNNIHFLHKFCIKLVYRIVHILFTICSQFVHNFPRMRTHACTRARTHSGLDFAEFSPGVCVVITRRGITY